MCPLDLAFGVGPPVERPHAVQTPAERAQDLCAQPIARARGTTARVGRTIVLDRQYVTIGLVRIDDGEIDLERTATDAMLDDPAAVGERARDRRGDRAHRIDIFGGLPRTAAGARERDQLC